MNQFELGNANLGIPGYHEALSQLSANLGPIFEYSQRLYEFWMRAPKDTFLKKSTLPTNVLDISMTLNVQLCRLFRAIQNECFNSDDMTANILARSMFETAIAIHFVLNTRVNIGVYPMLDKNGGHVSKGGDLLYRVGRLSKKTTPVLKNPSRSLRASLYQAHDLLSHHRLMVAATQTKGLKRLAKSGLNNPYPALLLNQIRAHIGPEWLSILKHGTNKSYSGMSVKDLAASIHQTLAKAYDVVYKSQSQMTHGADAIYSASMFWKNGVGPRWFSDSHEIYGTLSMAIITFLKCIDLMDKQIGLGVGISSGIFQFRCDWHRCAFRT